MDDYAFDLGAHRRVVTTRSQVAQVWFDRGLVWYYGFNHEEAHRCFRRATEHDPHCAMAHWGVASALGSNYNKPWEDFAPDELHQAVVAARHATEAALQHLDGAMPVESALIQALDRRYQSRETSGHDELNAWNDAYAAAMREAHTQFPHDGDVSALFVEAMINRTPWNLWDLGTGAPAERADTREAVAVLEQSLRLREEGELAPHPGLLHMYIHVMEMSPHPERALRACDALRDLVPDAGHLRHMPSHIDMLCGDYFAASRANDQAIRADRKYLQREGPFNFYTLSRVHDYHFKLYAAMFLGQYRAALEAAEELGDTIPEDLLRVAAPPMADWLEAFVAMKVHVLVRFGRWHEMLDEPLPEDPDLYSATTAMLHYGKGVANASLGRIAAAEAEQQEFDDALARVPESRKVFNNTCRDILAIAAAMLRGEIDYRKGHYESAFVHLRRAVALDDGLPYDEPWGWMQPARHALGALLLEQGHVEEASQVYRADLGLDRTVSRASQHPDNVWSLAGYVECMHRLGNHDEAAAMEARLARAAARADVVIDASCYCRIGDARRGTDGRHRRSIPS